MARRNPCRSKVLAIAVVLHTLLIAGALDEATAASLAPECVARPSRLLVEEESTLASVDLVTGERHELGGSEPRQAFPIGKPGYALVVNARDRWSMVSAAGASAIPIPGLAASGILLGHRLLAPPPRWTVERVGTASGTSFRIRDRLTGDVELAQSFDRRIELAASASSPDGRFFVYVQANNVASGIFIYDASARAQHTFTIPHDARLAAFAISLTFSPRTSCLALSMERDGDPAPATWIINLNAHTPGAEYVDLGFVLAWLPTGA